MKYAESLRRYRQYIANLIEKYEQPITNYAEPFCGRFHVGGSIHADHKFFSDNNFGLISLYTHIINGWRPPFFIGRKVVTYAWSRPEDFAPHVQAFIGHTYSRDGTFFGNTVAYKRFASEGLTSYKNLLRDIAICDKSTAVDYSFLTEDYRNVWYPENSVVFCHPPENDFDYLTFWDWVYDMKAHYKMWVALPSDKKPMIEYTRHFRLDTPIVYPVVYQV